MDGYIGFSFSEDSFVSSAIRFFRIPFYKNAPSHAFILFGEAPFGQLVGEATNPKIRLTTLDSRITAKKSVTIWRIKSVSTYNARQAIKKLLPLVGKTYGYLQLIGFIWVWLLNFIGIRADNPFNGGIVCAEYVFYYLKEVGYNDEELMSMKADNVAPDHILKSFKENPDVVLVGESKVGQDYIEWRK